MLNQIVYVYDESGERIERKITSIKGLPFYQSSGKCSSHPGTWFPFFGIQDDDNGFYGKGKFIKPSAYLHDGYFSVLLVKHFPNNPYNNALLHQRFSNLKSLVISAWLGGGLWETPEGKIINAELKKRYPRYYQKYAAPTFAKVESVYKEKEYSKVNNWLCQKAGVKQISEINFSLLGDILEEKAKIEILPQAIVFNYQRNRSNLGSKVDEKGRRRSARLKR